MFEPHELTDIPFAPGRVVWKREDVDDSIAWPRRPVPGITLPDETWIVGEALSCLFVGMQRWHRGERLSAARFVQSHALDRLIELDASRSSAAPGDPFNRERRVERRQPALAAALPALMPGYDATPWAALAMLDALRRRGAALDSTLVGAIEAMARAEATPTQHGPATRGATR